MNSYTLLLPFPPSNNSLHRNASAKNRYKSKVYTKWLKESDGHALTQKPFFVFEKRVDIEVYLNGGTDSYDCDNFLKAPIDYIVKLGIIKDDKKPYVKSAKAEWNEEIMPTIGCMVFIEECD